MSIHQFLSISLQHLHCYFSSGVPDVFLNAFQSVPLDFTSTDFYNSRKSLIEAKLETVRKWTTDQMADSAVLVWANNYGRSSIVSWEIFPDASQMQDLVRCIPTTILASISERILQNYRHYRSGFPDLIVWNSDEKVIIFLMVFLNAPTNIFY